MNSLKVKIAGSKIIDSDLKKALEDSDLLPAQKKLAKFTTLTKKKALEYKDMADIANEIADDLQSTIDELDGGSEEQQDLADNLEIFQERFELRAAKYSAVYKLLSTKPSKIKRSIKDIFSDF